MRTKLSIGLLLVLLVIASCALAQEVTGTISGIVKDASGAVVPNAKVTITNTDKNIVARTVTTDSGGAYIVPLLPVGHYKVEVEAANFQKMARTNIELNVNDRLNESFSLAIGSNQELVTVEANPVQVETQSVAAQGLITGTEVRQLSINNRNYEQLVALMPGVVYGGTSDQLYIGNSNPSGAANLISFSINGSRNSANNWTVDGADNVDRGSNLTALTYPSVDAIAEFKVLRGLYSAESGRGAGQINVVTRSGGSQFHGGAYEFWRNDALNANDYFRKRSTNAFTASHQSPLRYHDFGYNVGGPVYIPGVYNEKKDKTFFFWSQEFRRVIQYGTSSVVLPTKAMRTGVFPVDVCVGFNAARTACTTVLPAGTALATIDPVAAAYLKDVWKFAPEADNLTTGSTILSTRNQFNARQELLRVDHVFGPRLSIFGRMIRDTIPTIEPFGQFSTGTGIPNVATTSTNSPGRNYVFRATGAVTPNFLIEGGYNYSYGAEISRNTGAINPDNSPDVVNALQGKLPYPVNLARIPTITAITTASGSGPYDDFNRNYNIFGSASWLKGKHNFKFGGTWNNYSKTENTGNGNNPGTFAFNNNGQITGGNNAGKNATLISNSQTFANFLTGTVNTFSQIATDITPYIRMRQWELYAQDEWRVRPGLTLSYGVRYSYFPQPYNDNSQVLSNFDPSKYDPAQAVTIGTSGTSNGLIITDALGNPTTGNVLNGMIYASGALKNSPYGNTVGKQTNGNWAPRLGIAWDVRGDGKTSLRAGYGFYYIATLVGTYEQAMFGNPPFSASLTVSGDGISRFPTFQSPTGGVASLTAAQTPKTIRGVQLNGDVPYTQQYSLDLQHDFGGGFLFDVGYYGSKDTHLLGIVDINQPLPGAYVTAGISAAPLTTAQVVQLNRVRPFKGYGPINVIRPWFTGTYNSLQTSAEKRFKGGSIAKFNYTWSHGLTYNMSDRSNGPANTYDIKQNYGPTALDRRHVLTSSYVYALPWFKGQNGFLGHILGGWETSGILTIATGLPFNISGNAATVGGSSLDAAGQGCSGASVCAIRPNQVADPNVSAPNTVAQWFNTAAFVTNLTPGQVSTSRSGAILGPGYWKTDMSIFKQVKFTEQVGLQLRLETFNVFNHENFATVNTTFLGTQYGQITASRDPRLLQLGAKINF